MILAILLSFVEFLADLLYVRFPFFVESNSQARTCSSARCFVGRSATTEMSCFVADGYTKEASETTLPPPPGGLDIVGKVILLSRQFIIQDTSKNKSIHYCAEILSYSTTVLFFMWTLFMGGDIVSVSVFFLSCAFILAVMDRPRDAEPDFHRAHHHHPPRVLTLTAVHLKAGTYILDGGRTTDGRSTGGRSTDGTVLFLQRLNCSSLGAGLR